MKINNSYHSYHIVRPSFWPFFTSLALFHLILVMLINLNNKLAFPYPGVIFIILASALFLLGLEGWLSDVAIEGVYNGHHTENVNKSLRLGATLFIISEIMLFAGFFWGFFHASLAPSHQIGCVWPPLGLEPLNPYGLPLANTLILLTSGASLTLAHHIFILVGNKEKNKQDVVIWLIITIILGLIFSYFQVTEYRDAKFSINSGIFGSVFFTLTGLHGIHVLLGSLLLAVCLVRFLAYHFTPEDHFFFKFSCIYWHLVDGIWLFLFFSVYLPLAGSFTTLTHSKKQKNMVETAATVKTKGKKQEQPKKKKKKLSLKDIPLKTYYELNQIKRESVRNNALLELQQGIITKEEYLKRYHSRRPLTQPQPQPE